MPKKRPRVAYFVEDVAHEQFLQALVCRLANDEGLASPLFDTAVARGGHGTAISELGLFQKKPFKILPDLLIVVIDGNCKGWNAMHAEVKNSIDPSVFPNIVIGCPDPHIERWYLSDSKFLKDRFDVRVTRSKVKCERNVYKNSLLKGFQDAGHDILLGGAEFGQDIATGMNLFEAGKREPSLKHFIEDIRATLRFFATSP